MTSYGFRAMGPYSVWTHMVWGFLIQIPNELASIKLSYISPENDKIEKINYKNEEWEIEFGGKKKTGFQNLSFKENWCFQYGLRYGKVKNMKCYWEAAEKYQKQIMNNFGEIWKSIKYGNLDQK